MWRVIASFLCCFAQAAERPDEHMPLLTRSAQTPMYSGEQWPTKIKRCFAQENHVSVFYFPKEHERYSVTYDVNASFVSMTWMTKKRREKAIVPLLYALQQVILQGYVLRPGFSVPRITDTEFSHKDVYLERYCRKRYFSELLDTLLRDSIPNLEDHCKDSVDNDEDALTADMLKRAFPRKTSKRFFWQVVYKDQALEVLRSRKKKPEMLLIVGGVGMLWGRLTNCFLRGWLWEVNGVDKRSLSFYKTQKVLDKICTKYPFSPYKLEFCLNHTGKKTIEEWRERIRHDLAQDNHVKVFYFSKDDECYHAIYNISSETVITSCVFEDGTAEMVELPLLYHLHQGFLASYVLKPGYDAPSVRGIDFSENDVNLEHYDRQQFLSEELDEVFAEFLPNCDIVSLGAQRRLNRKGQICADDTFTAGEVIAFIADMRRRVLPTRENNQHFGWNVVNEDEAMEILYEIKKAPEVLLILGGVGMLWGRLTHCLPENIPGRNCRSLQHYKMRSQGVLRDLCAQYPCTQEERQPCSHDIETNVQETGL